MALYKCTIIIKMTECHDNQQTWLQMTKFRVAGITQETFVHCLWIHHSYNNHRRRRRRRHHHHHLQWQLVREVLRGGHSPQFKGPPPSLLPSPSPNAVSNGCTVWRFCSSLAFILHFLVMILNLTVLMTSAYSQHLKDSCKQYLALIRS